MRTLPTTSPSMERTSSMAVSHQEVSLQAQRAAQANAAIGANHCKTRLVGATQTSITAGTVVQQAMVQQQQMVIAASKMPQYTSAHHMQMDTQQLSSMQQFSMHAPQQMMPGSRIHANPMASMAVPMQQNGYAMQHVQHARVSVQPGQAADASVYIY